MSAIPPGTRRQFVKFMTFHGHARNTPDYDSSGAPIPIMYTAVVTTSWWSQIEGWMPNTTNPGPIDSPEELGRYRPWLEKVTPVVSGKPAMRHVIIVMILPGESYQKVREKLRRIKEMFGDMAVFIVKIYAGKTTNIHHGVEGTFKELYGPGMLAATEEGFIVAIHAEKMGDHIDTYDREKRSMHEDIAPFIEKECPQGEFSIEHISTADTIETVLQLPETVTGGFTPQHLLFSRNDFLEWWDDYYQREGVNLHLACRPPVRQMEDQRRILEVALNADRPEYRRFHLAPDSAAHEEKSGKPSYCGCNGVFSAPVLGPVMVDLYDHHGRLDHPAFNAFTYENAAARYKAQIDFEQTFELEKEDWTVPCKFGGIVSMCAGRTLGWKPVDNPAALNPHLLPLMRTGLS